MRPYNPGTIISLQGASGGGNAPGAIGGNDDDDDGTTLYIFDDDDGDGGSGVHNADIEYQWIRSTNGCPSSISQMIPGATKKFYNPGTISQTTYYVRLSRRVCTSSNVGGGGDDDDGGTLYSFDDEDDDNGGNGGLGSGTFFSNPWKKSNCIVKTAQNCGPCVNQGGDSDNDGVCNNQDCQPFNPNLPTSPGTPCNDNNSNTFNDVIQSDGCTCAGTPANPCANQGGDSDNDGVCNNQDCAPFDPNFPKPAGTSCNDFNPNTVNDVIQSDGCTCAGTPVGGGCNVNVSTDGCNINITGLTDQVTNVKVFNGNFTALLFSCNPWDGNPCNSTETISGLPNGSYVVSVQTSNNGTQACNFTEPVSISCGGGGPCDNQGGDSDNDGVCNNQDCQPFNPNLPTTPGTPCNDGNSNTVNDMIQSDGCSCAGTPVGPCDNQGGDSDNDGVCNNQDCQPFNPNFPTNPGTPCNDNNPNTTNDVVQSDGCSCAGTPVGGGDCSNPTNVALNKPAQQSSTITANGITGSASKAVDGNTNGTFFTNPPSASSVSATNFESEAWWEVDLGSSISIEEVRMWNRADGSDKTGPCYLLISDTPMADDLATARSQAKYEHFENSELGTPSIDFPNVCGRYVRVQLVNSGYLTLAEVMVIGCPCPTGGDPCANQGLDFDGDGVCANQDCDDFNPNVPTTPFSPCNDGNPNTENDKYQADGCTCQGTPIGGGGCPSPTNLAYNRATQQSSTITANGITGSSSRAVDGNTNGVYFTNPGSASSVSATTFENQAWWEVDLGGNYHIEEVRMFNRTDGSDNTGPCYLLISDSPFSNSLSTARSQAQYEHFQNSQMGHPDNVFPNMVGRYVRVQLANSGYLTLAEVEVHGCTPNFNMAVPNMLDFTAEKDGAQTNVSWVMSKDIDIDYYEVEVSTDEVDFRKIAEVTADGANNPRDYSSTDHDPSSGENFYRLKIIKNDGSFYYSNIRMVNFDVDFDQIIVYPNPTNDLVNVTLRDFAGKAGLVEVYNHLGQVQYHQNFVALPSVPLTLDVQKYVPGIYTIMIKVDNQRQIAKQFVVMDR